MQTLSSKPTLGPAKLHHAPQAVFALDPDAFETVFAESDRAIMRELFTLSDQVITSQNWRDHRDVLSETEFIFSGWKTIRFDEEFLNAAPRLKAVFHAAGSIKSFVTDAFWSKGIVITSAYEANAIPVAEYTLGTILLSLKQFWQRASMARQGLGWGDHTRPIPGSYRADIGLISLGMIGRKVVEMLAHHELKISAFDPYAPASVFDEFGITSVRLEELFTRCDVVSIHTPHLVETTGMIRGEHILMMKPGATLINTARGQILDQPSVVEALRQRPDVYAILDVTSPEPPTSDDPLCQLPNVIVTSHIAGSHGRECQRLGRFMLEEAQRYLQGESLRWQITREQSQQMA